MTRPLIPTINLSKDTPEVQADAIRHALSTVGFFIVEDSGMDPRVIQRVFADVGDLGPSDDEIQRSQES